MWKWLTRRVVLLVNSQLGNSSLEFVEYRKYSFNSPCQTKVFLRYLQSLNIAYTIKNLSLAWQIERVFTVFLVPNLFLKFFFEKPFFSKYFDAREYECHIFTYAGSLVHSNFRRKNNCIFFFLIFKDFFSVSQKSDFRFSIKF
jgi:hypothetical protein